VQAVEREEEEEEAIESVSNMAALPAPGPARVTPSASGAETGNRMPLLLPALVLIAAIAAAAIGNGSRRRPQPAFATTKFNRRYR
jgi:hypothetical protein